MTLCVKGPWSHRFPLADTIGATRPQQDHP